MNSDDMRTLNELADRLIPVIERKIKEEVRLEVNRMRMDILNNETYETLMKNLRDRVSERISVEVKLK